VGQDAKDIYLLDDLTASQLDDDQQKQLKGKTKVIVGVKESNSPFDHRFVLRLKSASDGKDNLEIYSASGSLHRLHAYSNPNLRWGATKYRFQANIKLNVHSFAESTREYSDVPCTWTDDAMY